MGVRSRERGRLLDRRRQARRVCAVPYVHRLPANYRCSIRRNGRINRRLEKWDQANQARADRDNARLGGDDWVERLDAETPGPRWAWALLCVPVIGRIGDLVILGDAWKKRRQGRRADRGGDPPQPSGSSGS